MHKDEEAEMCRNVWFGGMIRVVAGIFEGFTTFTRGHHRRKELGNQPSEFLFDAIRVFLALILPVLNMYNSLPVPIEAIVPSLRGP